MARKLPPSKPDGFARFLGEGAGIKRSEMTGGVLLLPRKKRLPANNRAVARIDAFSTEYHEMERHLKNMGRAIQGKPAETDAKENGKIARVFKGAFKVEGALISSINRNAEWALNTLARLEQTAERRPSVLEAMREQAAKTEPAKKQPASSHDKESR